MVRVRFAPNALSAVAGRRFAEKHGGVLLLLLLRIEEEAIVADLGWLGLRWDEGPLRRSERDVRHREAAQLVGESEQLATAVDDLDFGVTHVVCGSDHRPSEELQASLIRALGGTPPEYIEHGLLLDAPSLADLRDAGYPAEAVRAYLEELGLPRHDVHFDPARLRRLTIEALAALPDEELAARAGVPVSVVPAMRGARDLREARDYADQILTPERVAVDSPETLARLRELVEGGLEPRAIVRELRAVGGDLKAVRLVLTGRDRGPELAAVIESLSTNELLSRLDT